MAAIAQNRETDDNFDLSIDGSLAGTPRAPQRTKPVNSRLNVVTTERKQVASPPCFPTMEDPPAACSGVPPPIDHPGSIAPPRPKIRVCNACLDDAHCTDKPRGRCVRTVKMMCAGDGALSCACPGDGCYPGAEGHARSFECAICINANGRATCAPPPQMPPSAPPGPR